MSLKIPEWIIYLLLILFAVLFAGFVVSGPPVRILT